MFNSNYLRLGDVVPYASSWEVRTGEVTAISKEEGIIMLTLDRNTKVNVANVGRTAYETALAYKRLRLQENKRRLEEVEESMRSLEVEIKKLEAWYQEAKMYTV